METCSNCLCSIRYIFGNGEWVHMDSNEPECHEDDAPGCVAEPRY